MSRPKRMFRDEVTGCQVWQVTDGDHPHHHLYYLNPSFTSDGATLICVSYGSGRPNLVGVDVDSGEARTLTDLDNLVPFSGCPSVDNEGIYFTAGQEIRRVDLADGSQETITHFEAGVPGNCSINHDGSWIVTNLRKGDYNLITRVAADGSDVVTIVETSRAVGHVQFDRTPANRVLYSGDLTERVWVVNFDGSGDRLLYRQEEGEFLLHEFWLPGADEILVVHWPFTIRRFGYDGREAAPVVRMNAWHVAPRGDGALLVCDTNHPDTGLHLIELQTGEVRPLCLSRSSNMGTQWRYTFPREGAHMDVTMYDKDTGTRETAYGPQWTHPHPSFSPQGDKVVFTSDRSGVSQVYVAEVSEQVFG